MTALRCFSVLPLPGALETVDKILALLALEAIEAIDFVYNQLAISVLLPLSY
jgi:hypothetical protein